MPIAHLTPVLRISVGYGYAATEYSPTSPAISMPIRKAKIIKVNDASEIKTNPINMAAEITKAA
jgi:hypothetical protein